MIWYKIGYEGIAEVEVLRETEHCVYIRGYRDKEQRVNKVSEYDCYCRTLAEAVARVQDKAARELEVARSAYDRAQAAWDAVKDAEAIPVKWLKASAE